jgi:Family of unknown function (DUF5670)
MTDFTLAVETGETSFRCSPTVVFLFLSNFFQTLYHHTITMGNLLYILAIVLIIFWAVGFFAYSAGSVIHILLVIAAIAVLLRVIQGRKILR